MQRIKPLMLAAFIALVLAGMSWFLQRHSSVLSVFARPSDSELGQDPLIPSTPEDFILPGTQPTSLIHEINDPQQCMNCHANYTAASEQPPETRTWQAWQGSMMAQSGRDPLFFAALDIANAGAANAGEFCLRCHMPRGWLEGRSSAPDGSDMDQQDREGVQCAVCHRLVDPQPDPDNPERDEQILQDLDLPVTAPGSGQMIIDPEDYRRGPFDIVADLGFDPHQMTVGAETLISPYHQESDLCATCHDINNPMFTWHEESQTYKPNPLAEPGDISQGFPIERTYSEWKLSDYNAPQGVFAPEFGGNKQYVSSCQDCHMQKITGVAGAFFGGRGVVRQDMPVHDLTGGNTWVPQIIPLHPDPKISAPFKNDPSRADALKNGVLRARQMLSKAAVLDVYKQGDDLTVTIFNNSGHKLPTGYVEGRRMWIQVEGYDAAGKLVYVSGAYDNAAGELAGYGTDPALKVYEAKQGLTAEWAAQLGLPPGESFHFALNNQIVSDNRIPPRGYSFAAFDDLQAAPYSDGLPDPKRYADGQYWDVTKYNLPAAVVRGRVRLLYQTASKEYIEFLRDNNPNPSPNNGDILYDLWTKSGRSEPEVIVEQSFGARLYLPTVRQP